jgi:hypothetical protein
MSEQFFATDGIEQGPMRDNSEDAARALYETEGLCPEKVIKVDAEGNQEVVWTSFVEGNEPIWRDDDE